DSDDYFHPTFCEKAVEIAENNDDIKLITCFAQRFSDRGEIDVIKHLPSALKDFLKFNCSMGSSMLRKSDWTERGGYDEGMRTGFEDCEFYIRLLQSGGCTHVIPEILFFYRVREGSKTEEATIQKYGLLREIYTQHKELYINHYDVLIDHL